MSEWRHNQAEHQWELGYWDEARQEFAVRSWVTDEFIARTDHVMAAIGLHARLGTCPPPLAGYLRRNDQERR